jgi:hypothetical protein
MPIHDWTRVSAGTFHDFHNSWIVEIRNHLNGGLLPRDYYAMAEQFAGDFGPDVITLHTGDGSSPSGPTVLTDAMPKVRFTAEAEIDFYVQKQSSVVIRHTSDDDIVAFIEIVSPGNKANRRHFPAFLDKAATALSRHIHLLIVDLLPPSIRDPQGIHDAIWFELTDQHYQPPADKPLTLAAYSAGVTTRAYIEPVAVGDSLIPMPLFLEARSYVEVPLEATYQAGYRGVPERWRKVLEGV